MMPAPGDVLELTTKRVGIVGEREQTRRARGEREANEPGNQDDQRKRRLQEKDADERGRRDDRERRGRERAPADADQCLDHDHQHGGLDAEQRAFHEADAAAVSVKQAQGQHHQRARHDEQDAGNEAAAHTMQQPADIGRELRCLGTGQQHAEIERVQETRLVDPFLFVDGHAVHQRDLSCRAAERQTADLEPDLEGFREAG